MISVLLLIPCVHVTFPWCYFLRCYLVGIFMALFGGILFVSEHTRLHFCCIFRGFLASLFLLSNCSGSCDDDLYFISHIDSQCIEMTKPIFY